MTSIAFGGGPSLEQRRDFAGLKEGAHIPGYRGYCPQLKYKVGKSYGDDTHILAKERWAMYYSHKRKDTDHFHGADPVQPPSRSSLRNPLPRSTGDNKYTDTMVPGYTGYIPRMPFKFGGTYKEDCDVCIDGHLSNQSRYNTKDRDLLGSVRGFPRLKPLKHDPEVKHHLNTYRDAYPGRPLLMDDQRSFTEPPMPGYLGFIPRIHTTEMGLGARYHETTKKGLSAFAQETDFAKATQSAPITINRSPNAGPAANYNRRLYANDGMIPKYTGYVPQRRYNFGNTYGDTTRSLEVCEHDKSCFGDYLTDKPSGVYTSVA